MTMLISIIGPTAVGKSSLALQLAKRFNTHILSFDARQFYQYLDIGTAKSSEQELASVPHHFISHLLPNQTYSAAQYVAEVEALLSTLFQKHEVLVAVGGSTLYAQSLWYRLDDMPEIQPEIRESLWNEYEKDGLEPFIAELSAVDPQTFAKIDRNNPARVIRALEVYRSSGKPISHFQTGKQEARFPYKMLKIGLKMEREKLYERINQRVDMMLEAGLEEEVKRLLEMGYKADDAGMRSIGYQEMLSYIGGEIPYEEAVRLIKRNSRRYAKRQFTFFRKHTDIQWFEAGEIEAVLRYIDTQNHIK